MSPPDLVIILMLAVFAFSGISRGIVWELFTTIGLLIGFVLTWIIRDQLIELTVLITAPGWQRQWGGGLIFLFFFLVIYLGFATIGKHLHEGIAKTPLKWPDHILGLVGGAAKGAAFIALFVLALQWFDTAGKFRPVLNQSELIRWGRRAAYDLMHWESPQSKKWV